MVYNPSLNIIYVLDWAALSTPTILTRLDGTTGASLPSFTTSPWSGPNPFRVAIHPSTGMLYITNFYATSLKLMNTSGTVTNTVTTGNYPLVMTVNPVLNILYVTNNVTNPPTGPGSVTLYNATTGAYLNGTLPLSSYATGKYPQGIAVAP
jgi:DNA-binding beta-propeller fold protein YncE